MQEPFVGTIARIGFGWAPVGWRLCDGSLLQISDYEVLFNLIGTTYGGNGTTNFAVPNLQSRVPVGMGQGPGLQNYQLGGTLGVEGVTLTTAQMPAHGHTAQLSASAQGATAPAPANNLGYGLTSDSGGAPLNMFAAPDTSPPMNALVGVAGSGLPHENRQPFLIINYIIATQGIYPSQY